VVFKFVEKSRLPQRLCGKGCFIKTRRVALVPILCYTWVMSETLTIRLGEKLAHALQTEARETGLAKGEIARQALESRLQQGGKLAVMQRHFGSMTGPSDLSTNKNHRRTWNKKQA
jgi:hypothetical protein